MKKQDPEVHVELGRLEAMVQDTSGVTGEGRMKADAAAYALKWLFSDAGAEPASLVIINAHRVAPPPAPTPPRLAPAPPETEESQSAEIDTDTGGAAKV